MPAASTGSGASSALINPKLEAGVDAAVSQLLECIAPGSSEYLPGQKADKAAAKAMAAGLKDGKPLGTGETHVFRSHAPNRPSTLNPPVCDQA